jgi:hypothetical protein
VPLLRRSAQRHAEVIRRSFLDLPHVITFPTRS